MKKYIILILISLLSFSQVAPNFDTQSHSSSTDLEFINNLSNEKLKLKINYFIDNKYPILIDVIEKSKDEQEALRLVDILISNYKADVNAKKNSILTALIQAIGKGYNQITKLLIKNNAIINPETSEFLTPLMLSAATGNAEITTLLLEHGADIEAKEQTVFPSANCCGKYIPLPAGGPALLWAILNGHIEVIKILLDKGANINATNSNSDTALMISIMTNKNDITELLLNKGANINAQNNKGNTALMLAAKYNNKNLVQLLLEKGATINAQDAKGNTALMRAAKKEIAAPCLCDECEDEYSDFSGEDIADFQATLLEIIKMLLEHGADKIIKNNAGKTAKDIALENQQFEIAKLL